MKTNLPKCSVKQKHHLAITVIKHINIIIALNILTTNYQQVNGAIAPPPWSDTEINPCAALPGGWQMLYWKPLQKCFKIFQVGYPCPDTMELSPTSSTNQTAECRCPPGTAQSTINNECHTLFSRGPCNEGEYFSPIADVATTSRKNGKQKKLGRCKLPEECPKAMVFWPADLQCYPLYSRGPCPKGKLLTIGSDKITECKCENHGILADYFYREEETCHEHFTKGPCQKFGDLFLPSRKCGCHPKLPHYYERTNQCFELGTPGPCPTGHVFAIPNDNDQRLIRAACLCKDDYIPWPDGFCYRLYTRGPCDEGEFLINSTSCTPNFCGKGRLYFPEQKTCYKIGAQGPCSLYEVVVFDFTSRPSVDGISYNGVCGCSGILKNLEQTCLNRDEPEPKKNICESTPEMVEINGMCHKLYSQGPCGPGQWLEPTKNLPITRPATSKQKAKCKCRPGYTSTDTRSGITACFAPSVGLARYLNSQNNHRSYKFGFRKLISIIQPN